MYVDRLEYACKHGLCDYIAHPDVCLYSYPYMDESVRKIAQRIADISITYNMPLELNTGSGVHNGMHSYPDHNPSLFKTDRDINRALSVVEGLDLNFLIDYNLVEAAKKRKALFY